MKAPLEHTVEEIKRLRRCINDLVSVVALPATWSGGEPSQIVRTLFNVLPGMLNLDHLVLVDGDIGKQDTAMKVAEAAIREFGRIDLLVNSAGIYLPKPFTDYTPADFERRSPCRRQVVTRISKQNTKKPGEKGKDYEINQPSNGDCTHPFTQASMCEPIAHQHRTRIPRGSIK